MIYNEQKTSQHLANACVTKKTQNSIRTQNQMSDPNTIFRCHIRKSCFHSGKLMRRNRKYRNTSSNGAFSIAMSVYQSVLVIFSSAPLTMFSVTSAKGVPMDPGQK